MKVIDGTNMVLGRLATKAAKLALTGETVNIVNAEKVVIVGRKKEVLDNYRRKYIRGTSVGGPFIIRGPDRLVRRTIRGMIPYKTPAGKEAYARVMCYVGNPSNEEANETVDADVNNTGNLNYVTMENISKHLGAKL